MIYCTIKKLKCFWRETSLISRMPPFFTAGFRLGSGNSGSKLSLFLGGFFCCFCESREDFCSLDWLFGFFKLNHLHTEKEEGVVVLHLLLFSPRICRDDGSSVMNSRLTQARVG